MESETAFTPSNQKSPGNKKICLIVDKILSSQDEKQNEETSSPKRSVKKTARFDLSNLEQTSEDEQSKQSVENSDWKYDVPINNVYQYIKELEKHEKRINKTITNTFDKDFLIDRFYYFNNEEDNSFAIDPDDQMFDEDEKDEVFKHSRTYGVQPNKYREEFIESQLKKLKSKESQRFNHQINVL